MRGIEQTAGRAELRAALGAFEWAEEPTEVISDNDWVVKGTNVIIMGNGNPEGAHQDLWARMKLGIRRLGDWGSGDPLDERTRDPTAHRRRILQPP